MNSSAHRGDTPTVTPSDHHHQQQQHPSVPTTATTTSSLVDVRLRRTSFDIHDPEDSSNSFYPPVNMSSKDSSINRLTSPKNIKAEEQTVAAVAAVAGVSGKSGKSFSGVSSSPVISFAGFADKGSANSGAGSSKAARKSSSMFHSESVVASLTVARGRAVREKSMVLFEELMENELSMTDHVKINTLATMLLEHIGGPHKRDTENIYAGVVLREWLLQHGWNNNNNKNNKNNKNSSSSTHSNSNANDTLILGLGYLELYRRKNIYSEDVWLQRAKELFEQYFQTVGGVDNEASSKTVMAYCKLLMYMGLYNDCCAVIDSVLPNFETDPSLSAFLLCAGAAHKAAGNFETANNLFFDSCQIGPATPFSKIEMMTIISRNLEELGNDMEDGEDAYKMVHAHLAMEGIIDEDMDYDDWLYDASTWMNLADKCATHELFSLAADFYALSILKDHDAFRKPNVWYRFAKACKRCNRLEDALLSIKQAISRSGESAQLTHAYEIWSKSLHAKPEDSEIFSLASHNDKSVLPVLEALHARFLVANPEVDMTERAKSRIAAHIKGAKRRLLYRHGTSDISSVKSLLSTRVGINLVEYTLRDDEKGDPENDNRAIVSPETLLRWSNAPRRPLLMSIHLTWTGVIASIQILDVTNNCFGSIKIKKPFGPSKEMHPRARRLRMSVEVLAVMKGVDVVDSFPVTATTTAAAVTAVNSKAGATTAATASASNKNNSGSGNNNNSNRNVDSGMSNSSHVSTASSSSSHRNNKNRTSNAKTAAGGANSATNSVDDGAGSCMSEMSVGTSTPQGGGVSKQQQHLNHSSHRSSSGGGGGDRGIISTPGGSSVGSNSRDNSRSPKKQRHKAGHHDKNSTGTSNSDMGAIPASMAAQDSPSKNGGIQRTEVPDPSKISLNFIFRDVDTGETCSRTLLFEKCIGKVNSKGKGEYLIDLNEHKETPFVRLSIAQRAELDRQNKMMRNNLVLNEHGELVAADGRVDTSSSLDNNSTTIYVPASLGVEAESGKWYGKQQKTKSPSSKSRHALPAAARPAAASSPTAASTTSSKQQKRKEQKGQQQQQQQPLSLVSPSNSSRAKQGGLREGSQLTSDSATMQLQPLPSIHSPSHTQSKPAAVNTTKSNNRAVAVVSTPTASSKMIKSYPISSDSNNSAFRVSRPTARPKIPEVEGEAPSDLGVLAYVASPGAAYVAGNSTGRAPTFEGSTDEDGTGIGYAGGGGDSVSVLSNDGFASLSRGGSLASADMNELFILDSSKKEKAPEEEEDIVESNGSWSNDNRKKKDEDNDDDDDDDGADVNVEDSDMVGLRVGGTWDEDSAVSQCQPTEPMNSNKALASEVEQESVAHPQPSSPMRRNTANTAAAAAITSDAANRAGGRPGEKGRKSADEETNDDKDEKDDEKADLFPVGAPLPSSSVTVSGTGSRDEEESNVKSQDALSKKTEAESLEVETEKFATLKVASAPPAAVAASPVTVPRTAPLCTSGHSTICSNFAEGKVYTGGWKCQHCGKVGAGERWFCQRCDDNYCFECKPKEPIGSGPACNNKEPNSKHRMLISNYNAGPYAAGWWCSMCHNEGSGDRWFCQTDSEDICFTCRPRVVKQPSARGIMPREASFRPRLTIGPNGIKRVPITPTNTENDGTGTISGGNSRPPSRSGATISPTPPATTTTTTAASNVANKSAPLVRQGTADSLYNVSLSDGEASARTSEGGHHKHHHKQHQQEQEQEDKSQQQQQQQQQQQYYQECTAAAKKYVDNVCSKAVNKVTPVLVKERHIAEGLARAHAHKVKVVKLNAHELEKYNLQKNADGSGDGGISAAGPRYRRASIAKNKYQLAAEMMAAAALAEERQNALETAAHQNKNYKETLRRIKCELMTTAKNASKSRDSLSTLDLTRLKTFPYSVSHGAAMRNTRNVKEAMREESEKQDHSSQAVSYEFTPSITLLPTPTQSSWATDCDINMSNSISSFSVSGRAAMASATGIAMRAVSSPPASSMRRLPLPQHESIVNKLLPVTAFTDYDPGQDSHSGDFLKDALDVKPQSLVMISSLDDTVQQGVLTEEYSQLLASGSYCGLRATPAATATSRAASASGARSNSQSNSRNNRVEEKEEEDKTDLERKKHLSRLCKLALPSSAYRTADTLKEALHRLMNENIFDCGQDSDDDDGGGDGEKGNKRGDGMWKEPKPEIVVWEWNQDASHDDHRQRKRPSTVGGSGGGSNGGGTGRPSSTSSSSSSQWDYGTRNVKNSRPKTASIVSGSSTLGGDNMETRGMMSASMDVSATGTAMSSSNYIQLADNKRAGRASTGQGAGSGSLVDTYNTNYTRARPSTGTTTTITTTQGGGACLNKDGSTTSSAWPAAWPAMGYTSQELHRQAHAEIRRQRVQSGRGFGGGYGQQPRPKTRQQLAAAAAAVSAEEHGAAEEREDEKREKLQKEGERATSARDGVLDKRHVPIGKLKPTLTAKGLSAYEIDFGYAETLRGTVRTSRGGEDSDADSLTLTAVGTDAGTDAPSAVGTLSRRSQNVSFEVLDTASDENNVNIVDMKSENINSNNNKSKQSHQGSKKGSDHHDPNHFGDALHMKEQYTLTAWEHPDGSAYATRGNWGGRMTPSPLDKAAISQDASSTSSRPSTSGGRMIGGGNINATHGASNDNNHNDNRPSTASGGIAVNKNHHTSNATSNRNKSANNSHSSNSRPATATTREQLYKESMAQFNSVGYIQGGGQTLPFAVHWKDKVVKYLAGIPDGNHLRKRVAVINRQAAVNTGAALSHARKRTGLSVDECICALADADGSVGRVAERLNDIEFRSEIELVANILEIKAMVCLLEGGEKLYAVEDEKKHQLLMEEMNLKDEKRSAKPVPKRSQFDILRGIGALKQARLEAHIYDDTNDANADFEVKWSPSTGVQIIDKLAASRGSTSPDHHVLQRKNREGMLSEDHSESGGTPQQIRSRHTSPVPPAVFATSPTTDFDARGGGGEGAEGEGVMGHVRVPPLLNNNNNNNNNSSDTSSSALTGAPAAEHTPHSQRHHALSTQDRKELQDIRRALQNAVPHSDTQFFQIEYELNRLNQFDSAIHDVKVRKAEASHLLQIMGLQQAKKVQEKDDHHHPAFHRNMHAADPFVMHRATSIKLVAPVKNIHNLNTTTSATTTTNGFDNDNNIINGSSSSASASALSPNRPMTSSRDTAGFALAGTNLAEERRKLSMQLSVNTFRNSVSSAGGDGTGTGHNGTNIYRNSYYGSHSNGVEVTGDSFDNSGVPVGSAFAAAMAAAAKSLEDDSTGTVRETAVNPREQQQQQFKLQRGDSSYIPGAGYSVHNKQYHSEFIENDPHHNKFAHKPEALRMSTIIQKQQQVEKEGEESNKANKDHLSSSVRSTGGGRHLHNNNKTTAGGAATITTTTTRTLSCVNPNTPKTNLINKQISLHEAVAAEAFRYKLKTGRNLEEDLFEDSLTAAGAGDMQANNSFLMPSQETLKQANGAANPYSAAGTGGKRNTVGFAAGTNTNTGGPQQSHHAPSSAVADPRKMGRKNSIRMNHALDSLFEEQQLQGVPTVVMSKRDVQKAERDKLLLKSSKIHLKRPMQERLEKMTKVQQKLLQRREEVTSGQHVHPSQHLQRPEWGSHDIVPVPHRLVKQYTPRDDVATDDLFRGLRKPASSAILTDLNY